MPQAYDSWATGIMILLTQLSAWKSGRVESPLNNSHGLESFFRYELPVTNSTSVLTIGFLVHSSKWKNKKYTFSISYFPAILLELLQPRGRGCKVRAIFIMIILCWIWKKCWIGILKMVWIVFSLLLMTQCWRPKWNHKQSALPLNQAALFKWCPERKRRAWF